MKSKIIITLFSFILLLSSCKENDDEIIICTLQYVYGLNIKLIEKNSTSTVSGTITIVAKDGDYEETLENDELNTTFYGAGEREGTYILTITSDKYKSFVSEPIVVTGDECHVNTVSKTFELELK